MLTLALRRRAGSRDRRGVSSSERIFYDFLVNGASVLDEAARRNAPNADMTCVLTVNWPRGPGSEDVAPPLDDGRVELYVCPQCGDTGCGALTAVLSVSTTVVTWTEPRRYAQSGPGTEGLDGVGPFTFDRDHYVAALSSAPQFARPRRPAAGPFRRSGSLRRAGR